MAPVEISVKSVKKTFMVLKWNEVPLKGWWNFVFWTPYHLATAIAHAMGMAAGCPDARDAE